LQSLQAENLALRQQLADLRAGQGVFIEVNGQLFALNTSLVSQAHPMATFSVGASSPVLQQANLPLADTPTTTIAKVSSAESAKEALPTQNSIQEETGKQVANGKKTTFLEEALISEFASALDAPSSLSEDPINQQEKNTEEKNTEEQKAILRRDLMGSYLLD
jgi:hypothetical protein